MLTSIKMAQSSAADAKTAVQELYKAIVADAPLELVLFFCSSHYDLPALAQEINALFTNISVIGCTTAGEIGPQGYIGSSLTGVSFASHAFTVATSHFDKVSQLDAACCHDAMHQLKTTLDDKLGARPAGNRFALQLIDGLSNSEELLTHLVQRELGKIPLIGGTAGDDLKFAAPQIFYHGAFHCNAAMVAIVDTIFPIKIFKTQHFIDGNEPLVVTAADVASRTVIELNGRPAAQEYARTLGLHVDELNDMMFAQAPVVVHLNGNEYVRSIRQVHADGSLSFYCAIERGLILRVAYGVD